MHDVRFDGTKLRLAREFEGLTLTQLGERVALSPSYIAKLERAERQPAPDVVEALAEVLHVLPGFFGEELSKQVHEEACHFRSRTSTSAMMRARERARATLFTMLMDELSEEVEIPPFAVPAIGAATVDDVEDVAEKCRIAIGVGLNTPIESVVGLLELAGVVVTRLEVATLKIDAFSWALDRGVVVLSTEKGSGSRSRFDAAHELGHVVMHRDANATPYDIREQQANAFAAAFLMPRAAFSREFPRIFDWEALFQLKARWGASVAAIVRRARDLGLIGQAQYRTISKAIGMKGWRRGEPHELPLEEPSILVDALDLVEDKGHLLERLGWTRETFERVTGVPFPTPPQVSAQVIDIADIRARRQVGNQPS